MEVFSDWTQLVIGTNATGVQVLFTPKVEPIEVLITEHSLPVQNRLYGLMPCLIAA